MATGIFISTGRKDALEAAALVCAQNAACAHRYNQRMDEIRQFMITKSVPTSMRRRMIAFFNTLWSENAIYDEAEIISLLSPSM